MVGNRSRFAYVKDGFESFLRRRISTVVSLPDVFRSDDVVLRQHVDGVEDELAGGHVEVVRRQHHSPAIGLGQRQNDD